MKLLFLILFLTILTVYPQHLYEHQIIPFDGMDDDFFGRSIAVSDSFLFISSLRYSNHVENAVYVYRLKNNDYIFQYKIFPNDTQTGLGGALFSSTLLYKDNQLFVGAQNKVVNGFSSGCVYLFEYENYVWVEKEKIVPPWGQHNGNFSTSISKWGVYLLVGATHYDTNVPETGVAFLYKYINGNYEFFQGFTPFDGEEGQNFGGSVIINDSLILISSIADSTESGFSGSVYVYYKDDSLWSFKRKYIPEPNSDKLGFGTDMAVNDDFVFIGASGLVQGYNPGKVYIYKYKGSSFELEKIIDTGYNYFFDDFGIEIFAKKDTLLVGATYDTVKNENSGSVYLFVHEKGEWNKRSKIFPSDEIDAKSFGDAIIKIEDKIIIGAYESRVNNIFTGKVYIYTTYPLSIIENNSSGLEDFYISQNFPNPFNSQTTINYFLPRDGLIKFKVLNILGQQMLKTTYEYKQAGSHTFELNLDELPSGIYIYKIDFSFNNNFKKGFDSKTKKMLLIK